MKKIIAITLVSSCLSLSGLADTLAFERLTFSVQDVLDNATLENAKPEYKGVGPYDLEKLKSDDGQQCITRAISGLSTGNMPKGIADLYTDKYVFHNENCHTKAVIGHFCGSTLEFANKAPVF